MNRLILVSLLCVLLLLPVVHAEGFDLYVDEVGKVTSFYDKYYIARVNGTLTVTNPSEADFFNVIVPTYMSTYTVTSVKNTATSYIDETGIYIFKLPANSSVIFDYQIGGISTEKFHGNDSAILNTQTISFFYEISVTV